MSARDAALDLLNKGGCSIPMLAGELVKRKLVGKNQYVADAHDMARSALDALVAEGKCQKWPAGQCYTLPDKAPMESRHE